MKNWELLAEIDHAMMQISIDMMEWQGHLDMAALAGVGMPVELWTDDDPPKKITASDVPKIVKAKPVRVMHRMNGEWSQVGTGVIDSEGVFSAELTEDIPEMAMNTLRHFSVRNELPPEPSAYETLVAMPGSGVVEIPRVGIPLAKPTPGLVQDLLNLPSTKRSIKGLFPDIENHPFFKETPND